MKNQKGFSLIELLVVVIIIGIIAAIAIPSLLSSRRAAQEAQAASNLRTVNTAEQTYYATLGNQTDYGSYAEMTGGALLDTSFANAAVKGIYTYDAIVLGTNDDGFCATNDQTDAAGKSYATSHRGGVTYVAGVAPPACDENTGALGGTPLGN